MLAIPLDVTLTYTIILTQYFSLILLKRFLQTGRISPNITFALALSAKTFIQGCMKETYPGSKYFIFGNSHLT